MSTILQIAFLTIFSLAAATNTSKPNVVLIVSDDLRAQLGNVHGFASDNGLPSVKALGELASTGYTFSHAYANQALCGPSRNSFLSGRRPQNTKAYNFVDDFREVGANWTTLPQLFKENGYTSVGTGKIFHPGLPPDNDMKYSWDDKMSNGEWNNWMYPSEDACPQHTSWCGTTNETDLEDFKTTQTAIQLLDNVTREEGPFFLAVGFRKPHLQWRVPQRVLDEVAMADVTAPSTPFLPSSTPDLAYHMPVDDFLLEFTDVERCGSANLTDPGITWFSEGCARLWRRGYYAAVQYMDEQVGVILRELRERNLEQNTIVAFFGDHGWHLGEFGMWEKFSNFEVALRTPLFIRAPGISDVGVIDIPVELVDIYRTLADLAGLDLPDDEVIDGKSLVPMMRGALNEEQVGEWTAFSQFPRCLNGANYASLPLSKDDRNVWRIYGDGDRPSFSHEVTNLPAFKLTNCNEITADGMDFMGLSVRTVAWRFTAWFKFQGEVNFEAGAVTEELYEYYKGDTDMKSPNNFDNVVDDPANAEAVKHLRRLIQEQWG